MRRLIAYLKQKTDQQSRLLLRNTSWILGSSIIRNGLVFIRSIVVARCLGLELYGVYVIIASFVVAMQDFFNLNIGHAFIKFGAEFRAEKRTDMVVALIKACFYATLCTAAVSLLVTGAVVLLAYHFIIDTPGLSLYVFLFAVSDVATFFDPMGKSVLRLYYKFKINSIIQTVTAFIEVGIICLAVVLRPHNLEVFFLAVVSIKLVNLCINLGVVYFELKPDIGPHLDTPIRILAGRKREIIRFVTGNSLSKSLQTLMSQGDTFLLGSLAGAASAAYYNIAKKLANMFAVVTDPFTLSIYPQLSNLVAEKKTDEIKTMLVNIIRTSALPAVLIIAGMMWLNEWVVSFFYGADYLPAAGALRVTILTAMVSAVFFWNQGIMLSLGLIRFRFFVYLLTLAAGLLIAFLLVPAYQATGMAATVFCMKTAIIAIFTYVSFNKLNILDSGGQR